MMAEVTREMITEVSTKIVAKLIEWTDGMNDEDRAFKIYNEAISDAVAYVTVMAEENPKYRLGFESLATKMRRELPLLKE